MQIKAIGEIYYMQLCSTLHTTLPYSDDFYQRIPSIFRTMIDIEISEINEQLNLPGNDGKAGR